MAGLWFTYIVTACAMITATAAAGAFGYLRRMAHRVDKNESRSEKNHRLLTGKDAPEYEGVIPKLKRLEEQGGES